MNESIIIDVFTETNQKVRERKIYSFTEAENRNRAENRVNRCIIV